MPMPKIFALLILAALPTFSQVVYPIDIQRKVDSLTDAVQRLEKGQEADRDRASEVGNNATSNVVIGIGSVLLLISFLAFINYRASKTDFEAFESQANARLDIKSNETIQEIHRQYREKMDLFGQNLDSIPINTSNAIKHFEDQYKLKLDALDKVLKGIDSRVNNIAKDTVSNIEARILIKVYKELGHFNKVFYFMTSMYSLAQLEDLRLNQPVEFRTFALQFHNQLTEARTQGFHFTGSQSSQHRDTEELFNYFKECNIQQFINHDLSFYI